MLDCYNGWFEEVVLLVWVVRSDWTLAAKNFREGFMSVSSLEALPRMDAIFRGRFMGWEECDLVYKKGLPSL